MSNNAGPFYLKECNRCHTTFMGAADEDYCHACMQKLLAKAEAERDDARERVSDTIGGAP